MKNTGHMELLSQLKSVEADIWQYDKELAKLATVFCMSLQTFYCIGAVKYGTIFQTEVALTVLS